jgi:hypothetical protein
LYGVREDTVTDNAYIVSKRVEKEHQRRSGRQQVYLQASIAFITLY